MILKTNTMKPARFDLTKEFTPEQLRYLRKMAQSCGMTLDEYVTVALSNYAAELLLGVEEEERLGFRVAVGDSERI